MPDNIIVLSDRIKELSNTTGSGNMQLEGAATGFSAFGDFYSSGDYVYYAITDGTYYEIGSGQYQANSYDELIRFPFRSTTSDTFVNWPEGVKEIYVTYPATYSVYTASGLGDGYNKPQASGLSFWESANILNYDSSIIWDSTNKRIGLNTATPAHSIDVGGGDHSSIIRASGFITSSSGISFPSGNSVPLYSGGTQLEHFLRNELDATTGTSAVFQLSGIVDEKLLFEKQAKGHVLSGPPSGCGAECIEEYPSFRYLTLEDIPDLSDLYVTPHNFPEMSGVAFWHSSGVLSYDGYFVYDAINNYLGVNLQLPTEVLDVGGNARIRGNLDVDGDVTYIDSTVVTILDKNLELASLSGQDVFMDNHVDGGGLILKSSGDGTNDTGDKLWVWYDATEAWTTSGNIDISGITGLEAGSGLELVYNGNGQLLRFNIDDVFDIAPNAPGTAKQVYQNDTVYISGVSGITTHLTYADNKRWIAIDPGELSGILDQTEMIVGVSGEYKAASGYLNADIGTVSGQLYDYWASSGDAGLTHNITGQHEVYFSGGASIATTQSELAEIAALATVTITDFTELNTGDKVNLIATDGTNYDFVNGDQSSVNGTWESATSNDQTATNLMNVINTSSGPAGTRFSASVVGAVVTITQNTTGKNGNTVVTLTDAGTAGMTKTDFAGGKDHRGILSIDLDDPVNLTNLSTSAVGADQMLIWDEDAGAWKYITLTDLTTETGGGAADDLLGASGKLREDLTGVSGTLREDLTGVSGAWSTTSGTFQADIITASGSVNARLRTAGTGLVLDGYAMGLDDPTSALADIGVGADSMDWMIIWDEDGGLWKTISITNLSSQIGGGTLDTTVSGMLVSASGLLRVDLTTASGHLQQGLTGVSGEYKAASGYLAADIATASGSLREDLTGVSGAWSTSSGTLQADIITASGSVNARLRTAGSGLWLGQYSDDPYVLETANSGNFRTVRFYGTAPDNTTQNLYSVGTALYWNGSAVSAGAAYTAETGIALTGSNEFYLDDPANLANLSTSAVGADQMLIWDEDAGAWKYITITDLTTEVGGSANDLLGVSGMSVTHSGALNEKIVGVSGEYKSASGEFVVSIAAVSGTYATASGYLAADIVTASGALREDLTGASGALRTDLTGVSGAWSTSSGTFQGDIITASGALRIDLVAASGKLREDFIGASGALRTDLTGVSGAWSTSSGTFQADILTASGALDHRVTANAENIIGASGKLREDLIGASGALRTDVTDILTVSGALAGTGSGVIRVNSSNGSSDNPNEFRVNPEWLVVDNNNVSLGIGSTWDNDFWVDNHSQYSVLIGDGAGDGVLAASGSVIIGSGAAAGHNSPMRSVIIGMGAGRGGGKVINSPNNGTRNVMIGENAGAWVSGDPTSNVMIGEGAGLHAAHGGGYMVAGNIMLGDRAGWASSAAGYNQFIGFYSGRESVNIKSTAAMGRQALGYASSLEDGVFIGYEAGSYAASGDGMVGIGRKALMRGGSGGDIVYRNTAVGHFDNIIGIGTEAGLNLECSSLDADDRTYDLVLVGHKAGKRIEDSRFTSAIGHEALLSAHSVDYSFVAGKGAGALSVDISDSNFIGTNAGISARTLDKVNVIGYHAGESVGVAGGQTTSFANMIGHEAGSESTNCSWSDMIGDHAGHKASGIQQTVMLGRWTGMDGGPISQSVMIGAGAGMQASGADSAVMIGRSVGSGVGPGDYFVGIGERAGADASSVGYSTHIGTEAGAGSAGANGSTGNIAKASGEYNLYLGRRAGYKNIGHSNLTLLANSTYGDVINGAQGTLASPSNWKLNIANVIGGDHRDNVTGAYNKRISVGDINSEPTATVQIVPRDSVTTCLSLEPPQPTSESLMLSKSVQYNYNNTDNRSENEVINSAGFLRIPTFKSKGALVNNLSAANHPGMIAIYFKGSGSNKRGYMVFSDGFDWRVSGTDQSTTLP